MRHTHSERKPASIDNRSDDGLSINRRLNIYNNLQYPARFFSFGNAAAGFCPYPTETVIFLSTPSGEILGIWLIY